MEKTVAKILSCLVAIGCLLFGVCFVGCNQSQAGSLPTTHWKTYCGVVQTLEENEGLYVFIPSVGVCELPSYEEGKQQDIAVKEGDLLRMDFNAKEVTFMERHPVEIKTPVHTLTVQMENVALEQVEKEYSLTFDNTKETEDAFLAYEKAVGDTVYFTGTKFVAGTDSVGVATEIYEYCTATIENLSLRRITLRLHLGIHTMQDFLVRFATRAIRLQAEIADERPIQSFFALIEKLQKSDIQKIETVEYAGSVQPNIREPITYKTSTLTTDTDAVFPWLKSLNGETLTSLTEEEATIEGSGETDMTVYTVLGTLKIKELGRGYLRVWNNYFAQEAQQRMPDIEGETVTYKFESYSDKADIYMGILDDGIKVGKTRFSFGKMVCKLSDKTFNSEQFRLVADIGELTVYDSTHFARNGKTYEIINLQTFSQLISEFFSELGNKQLLLKTYEEKYPNSGKAELWGYYGKYGNGALVGLLAGSKAEFAAVVWTETVAGCEIEYGNANRIRVLYEDTFYTLSDAYDSGYLTAQDIEKIANLYDYFRVVQF